MGSELNELRKLREERANRAAVSNHKARIKMHQKLKHENNKLRDANAKVIAENQRLKLKIKSLELFGSSDQENKQPKATRSGKRHRRQVTAPSGTLTKKPRRSVRRSNSRSGLRSSSLSINSPR